MSGQYRQDAARLPPQSLAKRRMARHARAQFIILGTHPMSTALKDQIHGLIEPFNKKGAALTDTTTFAGDRSEEHTSELQSLLRPAYPVLCPKKPRTNTPT